MSRRWSSTLAIGLKCNARVMGGIEQGDARTATEQLTDQYAAAKMSGYRVSRSKADEAGPWQIP
jgi:hypothetical protein